MKKFYIILNIFFELSLITIIKGDSCLDDQISISTSECLSINDFLDDGDLTINTNNLHYLANNRDGKISKNGYKLEIYNLNDNRLQSHDLKISKLYIPNTCIQKMKNNKDIKLDTSQGIVILVYDSNNLNDNNITDNYFIIRHNSINTKVPYINSKIFDLSFCSKDTILFEDEINIINIRYNSHDNNPIDIDKIINGKNNGIDLFDIEDPFFNDICFKFTSEKGTDVILESRVEYYYQNITFCDETKNSHYIAYNYSAKDGIITYRCAFGFYKNNEDKDSYLDKIENKIKSLVAVSNIKVITCYKEVLRIKNVIKNFGGMICLFIFIIEVICFITFCCRGTKRIEEQLDKLFNTGKIIIRRLSKLDNNIGKNIAIEIEQEPKEQEKEFELWGNGNPLNKKQDSQNLQLKQNKINVNNSKKIREICIKETEDINDNNNKQIRMKNIIEEGNEKNDANSKVQFSNFSKNILVENNEKIYNSSKKNMGDNLTERGSIKSQIYDYENDELNELTFDKAIKHDKRNCCQYYGSILICSHVILNVFCRPNDYNLFNVKLGLLFLTFTINLTFNILFYTSNSIKINYIKTMDDISTIWDNMKKAIYSSLLSNILLIILKFLCLTHDSIRSLRKIKDINMAQKKSKCLLRCCKFRIFIYYILSFAFLIVFGAYIICFCSIYENTQISLIKSTFISWTISLIYPFILCFITSLFRSFSLICNSSYLYCVKQFLQLF